MGERRPPFEQPDGAHGEVRPHLRPPRHDTGRVERDFVVFISEFHDPRAGEELDDLSNLVIQLFKRHFGIVGRRFFRCVSDS